MARLKTSHFPMECALDSEPPPSTIYHYTTDQGLRGILENGSLWVTDIFSLNDPSELKHGLQIAEEALTATAKNERILSEFLAKEMRVISCLPSFRIDNI